MRTLTLVTLTLILLAACNSNRQKPQPKETAAVEDKTPQPVIMQPERVGVEFSHPLFFRAKFTIVTKKGQASTVLPGHPVQNNPGVTVSFPLGMEEGFEVTVKMNNGKSIHYQKANISMRYVVIDIGAASLCEGRPSVLVAGSEVPGGLKAGSHVEFFEEGLYSVGKRPQGRECQEHKVVPLYF